MKPILSEFDQKTGSLDLGKILSAMPREFLKPDPKLYFIDLILTTTIASSATLASAFVPFMSWTYIALILVGLIATYRATFFIHETVHAGKHIKYYNICYNLLHGYVYKFPTYIYEPHLRHHQPDAFGTFKDPEYERIGGQPVWLNYIIVPLIIALLAPFIILIRWSVIPLFLPFIGKKGRSFIYDRTSTFIINAQFRRGEPNDIERKEWYVQDGFCMLYSLILIGLVAFGFLPLQLIASMYIILALGNGLNVIRGNLEHRYYSEMNQITHKQMILDSVTLPHNLLTMVLFPVGLGYHALHHMFGQIPYHNLDKAHDWLMTNLPPNHPYRATLIPNLRAGMRLQAIGQM